VIKDNSERRHATQAVEQDKAIPAAVHGGTGAGILPAGS
jgi:hypothetical protein